MRQRALLWKALLIATIINFTLFKFLISQRVPGVSPIRFTETFTSQRRDPWCECHVTILHEVLALTNLFHVAVARTYGSQECLQSPHIAPGLFW